MVTMILRGSLGNILFQYAVGRHLALKNNTTLHLNLLHCMRGRDILARRIVNQIRFFKISATLQVPLHTEIARRLGINWPSHIDKMYEEKYFGFDPNVLMLGDGFHLYGWFQSEKYFREIEPIIQNDLSVERFSFNKEGSRWKAHIANSNSVSVHVRRGDYLKSSLHDVCDMNYYAKAMKYMQDRLGAPPFYVFSDDMDWCRKNMDMANCHFVDSGPSHKSPISDLQLIRSCKHHIIANSTFSWWAAWLNENPEKIVVTPNRWFNDEVLNSQALRDTIPDGWVRIEF